MTDIEKLLWYLQEYGSLIALSLFYFTALSLAGYFLILRRSVFFGLVITKTSSVQFYLWLWPLFFFSFSRERGAGTRAWTRAWAWTRA